MNPTAKMLLAMAARVLEPMSAEDCRSFSHKLLWIASHVDAVETDMGKLKVDSSKMERALDEVVANEREQAEIAEARGHVLLFRPRVVGGTQA